MGLNIFSTHHTVIFLLISFLYITVPVRGFLFVSRRSLITSKLPAATSITSITGTTKRWPTTLVESDEILLDSTSSVTEIDTHHKIQDNNNGTLSSLFGSKETWNDFFQFDIGRNVVYIRRSPSDCMPPLAGIDTLSLYRSNEWINLRKRGSRDLLDKNIMSYTDFCQYIEMGGSAVIPIISSDYMNTFKVQIEKILQQEVSMNVYHSGPSAVALNIHYDTYDVLVLQLDGQKEWMIQSGDFGKPIGQISKWSNVTMTPGDLLYMPKGVFHAATTTEGFETTTHVTIGLENMT